MYPSTYFSSQLSWCQICSRSSPTHQRCFNCFSSYRAPIQAFLKFISESLSKIQTYPVHIPGVMLETLELSESVNSADLVTFIIYISGHGPPIEVNPIRVVQKFHKIHSVQNSSILVSYTESYARNFGGSRICQHFRHRHLV
jgi:hypothetical protein